MNYQKIYNQLIDRAKIRNLKGVYFERHHIIPRAHGGNNKKENLVKLTAREHLLAHLLLWKIHKDSSMACAVWFMAHTRGIRINSHTYETLRIQQSIYVANKMKGRIVTQHTRDLIGKAHIGKIVSQSTKDLISVSRQGSIRKPKGYKHSMSEEEKLRRSNRKGKGLGNPGFVGTHTPESIDKMRAKKENHPPTNFKRMSANGIIFPSAVAASKELGVTYNWLMRRIKMDKYPNYFYI